MSTDTIKAGDTATFRWSAKPEYCTERDRFRIFATPWMVLMIEKAAMTAIEGSLADGETTVGVTVNLAHLGPAFEGDEMSAVAEVSSVDGNKVDFEVQVYRGDEMVGRATHTRAVLNLDRYVRRLEKLSGGAANV